MGLLHALRFLTRLPIPALRASSPQDLAAAQAWFPAAGLVIGALIVGVDRLVMRALPPQSVDVLVIVALVAITGALHLDGLADAADGLFGGRDAPSRLEIMRDARTGAFGVCAVVSVLALKWAGLQALTGEVRVEALLLAPCAARAGMLAGIASFRPARADGLGATARAEATPFRLTLGVGTALVAGVALIGVAGAGAVLVALAAAIAVGAVAMRLAGGVTGDVHGASIEIAEACVLLFLGAMAQRGWADALLLG